LCAIASMHTIFTPPAGTCRRIRESCSFSSCDRSRRPIPVRRHERLYQQRLGNFRLVTEITARHPSVPAFLLSAPSTGALHGVSS
jgi:hypothetical protein